MTRNSYLILREDIRYELTQIDELVQLTTEKYHSISTSLSIWETAGMGKAISDFYTGIERIFLKIATKIDQDVPEGEDWHIQLIGRMHREIEQIRPAVISKDTGKRLREYLGFRHLFRNLYGMDLDWEEMKDLVDQIEVVFNQVKREIDNFCRFLEQLYSE